MTAIRADMRVLALGNLAHAVPAGVELQSASVLVLCEMPEDSTAALQVGAERDWCTPGAWSGVVFALAEARIGKAGAAGVAELHRREVQALERSNALAEAVQSIGQAVRDAAKDVGRAPFGWGASESEIMFRALDSVLELVNSVSGDLAGVEPAKSAREVLAAHGWECVSPNKPSKHWARDDSSALVRLGTVEFTGGESHPVVVLRAFATLAEESRP